MMADCQESSNIQDYRGKYRLGGTTPLQQPSPIQTGTGETAGPSSLMQQAINMANADFVQRATPHPQTASPLQKQIIEELQAKEDPMEDEIEGLDAEVLLNADPLEEGEQAAVDLEEPQTTHPPPSQTSHTPLTLQQTPPPSMQASMSAIDLVQQLVQVLLAIGQNMAAPAPPNPPPPSQSCVCVPDTFDGSNPEDLQAFILQCQITFNSYLHQYLTDTTKVFFAISYLKKMALEWFKQGVLEDNPEFTLAWCHSWVEFIKELRTHFRPTNPVGSAKIEL